MSDITSPDPQQLPTIRQLNRAAAIAIVVAGLLVVTTVLPAEYGIDPVGTGDLLGLTPMGMTKQAAYGAAPTAEAPVTTRLPDGTTEIRLIIPPFGGKEVKATMQTGRDFTYSWSTDGPPVDYEFHGDREGAAEDDYTSYKKATSTGERGDFRAGFTGRHGWYWENLTSQPITVTVRARGGYDTFKVLE